MKIIMMLKFTQLHAQAYLDPFFLKHMSESKQLLYKNTLASYNTCR